DVQVPESEACLSLNIWAPSTNRKQSTAVMIWIYGGAFTFGTSNTPFYDGTSLIGNNNDVTLVTINYRTNIFGFPGAPQLAGTSQSQNFGALDVDAAIQWVFDNIANFGGDPERITIFGQSAGSGLVATYTFSHPTDTRVKGGIQESGSLAGLTPELTAFGGPLNTSVWNTVAGAVGCGQTANAAQLACMKTIPFRTLEDAVESAGNDFVPVQDGITFFSDLTARSAAGDFLKIPLLVGNTRQEGDIFIAAVEQLDLGTDIPGLTELGGVAVTKVVFSCPAGTTTLDRVNADVPVFRYRYDGIFPDISHQSDLNAFHGSEIPIVFGTYNLSLFGPPTSAEITLSSYVQGAWVAFARDPVNGLVNYGWPRYNPVTNSLVLLGNPANQSGVAFTNGLTYDLGCGVTEVGASLALALVDLLGGIF
ncbi:hypothetical protein M422DRAFT_158875, partial [Sphaerobolus stellatus SS14]